MRRTRPIVRSLVFALVGFCALMALSTTGFYPPAFRACANRLFCDIGKGRIAKFEPFEDPLRMRDTRVQVGTVVGGAPVFPANIGINSVREGFAPAALLAALALASPIAWRLRLRTLGIGLVLVHVFVALRVLVLLLYGFSRVGIGDRHLLEVGSLGRLVLHRADQVLTGDLHLTYILPIAIWALLTVREDELRSLWIGREGGPATPHGSGQRSPGPAPRPLRSKRPHRGVPQR